MNRVSGSLSFSLPGAVGKVWAEARDLLLLCSTLSYRLRKTSFFREEPESARTPKKCVVLIHTLLYHSGDVRNSTGCLRADVLDLRRMSSEFYPLNPNRRVCQPPNQASLSRGRAFLSRRVRGYLDGILHAVSYRQ